MEPFVSVAEVVDGRVTLHTASQGPSFVRIEIARLLGLPENRVRVRVPYLGGGFGGKTLHQARSFDDGVIAARATPRSKSR
jgi:CO/xanthine dehydrogenase Mo-binding subunit